MQNKECLVYYSAILELPIVGDLIILLEVFILLLGIAPSLLYFSNEDRWLTRQLVKLCNIAQLTMVFKTIEIGQLLRFFQNECVLDLEEETIFSIRNEAEYQKMMWSLMITTKWTNRTKKMIYGKYPLLKML